MYSGRRITFDSACSWSFDNGTARNVIIYDVDSISSSHVDNRKNNCLILSLGPTYEINGKFDSAEKKYSINFTKSKFCLSLRQNNDNSYLFVNEKEVISQQ